MLALAKAILENKGAASVGAVPLWELEPYMTAERVFELARFRSVIVAAFPYYAGEGEGNLARYCRGLDYHRVVGRILHETAEAFPGLESRCLLDSGAFPEVVAARLSGVAATGLHGLAMTPFYGSYVFIGCILCNADLPAGEDAGFCDRCGSCVRACPTGAISAEGPSLFRRSRCLSQITQGRRIGREEEEILRLSPFVFGCDLCQEACPKNRGAAATKIPEFLGENLMMSLGEAELLGLSERGFRRKYSDRAFSFRGLAPILRNLRYYGSGPPKDSGGCGE